MQHHVKELVQGVCFDDDRMRYQEQKPSPWMVKARVAEAWTPTQPRPHEGESEYYSLPITKPDANLGHARR